VLGLLLVLSLLLAGCGEKITAEEIVAKMQETLENTQNAHALVTANLNAQGIEMSVTAEVWEKSPNKGRAEVIESSRDNFAGMVMVSDGEQVWLYEPTRNVVTVGPLGEVEMPLPQEILIELQRAIQDVLDISDVQMVGEEIVLGHEAYKLTVSPKEGTDLQLFPGNGTATLWVDKEQWIVLKVNYEAGTFGQGSLEVNSFELNPGLSDDLFRFDIPAGTEVIDLESQRVVALTLDEARAEAGFQLLVPDYVPGGVTLIEVFKSGDSIILRYDHSPEVSFTIVQGPELTGPPPLGETQAVTVRGQSATVITDEAGGNTFLYWTEDGVTVTVAGHITFDEALQVAESLR
jgi:outer membrane lipoprotein-sorting protein